MPWDGRITDRMIAAHDRALGSPEWDEEDPEEEEEEGTYDEDDEQPELTDVEVKALQQLQAERDEHIFLEWLGLDKEGKPDG